MGNVSYGWFSYSSYDKPPSTSFQCTQKAHFIIILSSRVYGGIPNLNSKYIIKIPLTSKQHNFNFISNAHFRLTFTVHVIFNSLYFFIKNSFFFFFLVASSLNGLTKQEHKIVLLDLIWDMLPYQSVQSRLLLFPCTVL